MYKILKTTLLLINIILSNQKVIATYQHPYTIDKVWSVINTDSIVSTVMINLEQLNNSLLRAPKLSERIESKTYLKMPSMNGLMYCRKCAHLFYRADTLLYPIFMSLAASAEGPKEPLTGWIQLQNLLES